jgi:putative DNA methylase
MEGMLEVLAHLTEHPDLRIPQPASPTVAQGSATALPWPDDFFRCRADRSAVLRQCELLRDLSDFFYVWLKRTLGDLYPELFATPPHPQSREEIVADANTERVGRKRPGNALRRC